MESEVGAPFEDNWAYLKVELHWLDRVLMLAVARQRQETKEIERVSQSKADRATSHWWKGLIAVNSGAYDDTTQPKSRSVESLTRSGYQQQLDLRIQASQGQGVSLGLPTLRDRLGLTLFEKNLVLMCLAPEIHRRYLRLYHYLNHHEPGRETRSGSEAGCVREKSELPTVDLVLRLLCRNDAEWRTARTRLVAHSPLVQLGLLKILPGREEPLLSRRLQLREALVTYLLAETPHPADLEHLLDALAPAIAPAPPPQRLNVGIPATEWTDLVLPSSVLTGVKHLYHRVQVSAATQGGEIQVLNLPDSARSTLGTLALWGGQPGTGKTLAATAIAHALKTSLVWVNLAQIDPSEFLDLFQEIRDRAPPVLLIESAHRWLGRTTSVPAANLHQFLAQRRQLWGITVFTVEYIQAVQPLWRRSLDQVLEFPMPHWRDRLVLWQKAFPSSTQVDPDLDWQKLARRWVISGGEIQAIARDAVVQSTVAAAPYVRLEDIVQARAQRSGLGLKH